MSTFDAHKNFAYSTVATAPSPATSGTSLVVAAGDGAKFPTAPFNATIWPVGVQPTNANAEIVRVTAVSTDTLTITRIQESSSARTVIVGDQISATITVKTLTDVEGMATSSLVQNETPGGLVNGSNTIYTTASTFATGSLRVYLNGQRLTAGSGVDYVEVTQGFTMQYAPVTGDVLLVDYNVNNSTFIQGSNSSITDQTPTGSVNGSNTSFTVTQAKYVANTLEVYLNGLHQIRGTDYTETTPTTGVFTMTTAPVTGDIIRTNYQFSTGASGNADTVDGIHANTTPTASQLVPLDSNARFDQVTLALGVAVQTVSSLISAVATGTTVIPLDDTIPQITEGTEFITVTITPKATTNILVIQVQLFSSMSGTTNAVGALFQDANANALAVGQNFNATVTAPAPVFITHTMAAGTTSATTFRVRAGSGTTAGTITINGQSGARQYGTTTKSSIIVTEYKA